MKKILFSLLVAFSLTACSTPSLFPPTPFETGMTVIAPQGCLDLRKQNAKADC